MSTPTHFDGARLDFSGAMSYGDYLRLDELLAAQRPLSGDHNEMLFIVQHQTSELWMKLALHELIAARGKVQAGDLQPAFKMLARVARIMAQLNQSWDVLATLTPAEYSSFRAALGSSSGFQSHQYRMVEFLLGNKDAMAMEPHRHRAELFAMLEDLHRAPSLYDEAIRLLARRGLPIDRECVERDCRSLHAFNESVCAPWHGVAIAPRRAALDAMPEGRARRHGRPARARRMGIRAAARRGGPRALPRDAARGAAFRGPAARAPAPRVPRDLRSHGVGCR